VAFTPPYLFFYTSGPMWANPIYSARPLHIYTQRDNSVHLHECSPFWVGIFITFIKENYHVFLCYRKVIIFYVLCKHGNILLSLTLNENTISNIFTTAYTYCRNNYPCCPSNDSQFSFNEFYVF